MSLIAISTPIEPLLRRVPRSAEIQGAPRRVSRRFDPGTPKSGRIEAQSSSSARLEERNFGGYNLLSPTSRGSPMLPSRNGSPKSSPNRPSSTSGTPSRQSPKSPNKYQGDRFIPTRQKMDVDVSNFVLKNGSPLKLNTPVQRNVPRITVLSFGNETPQNEVIKEPASALGQSKPVFLQQIKSPEKVLDAPYVLHSPGMHLLDWSDKNSVALALRDSVYLWDSLTHKTVLLGTCSPFLCITGVKWNEEGTVLAVASSNGKLHCWRQDTEGRVDFLNPFRVTSISWNKNILTCGDIAGYIRHYGTRNGVDDTQVSFKGHAFAITTLDWNRTGEMLASGSEEEQVKIWSGDNGIPKHVIDIPVSKFKVCRWCPWLNTVVAVGTDQGHILLWRTSESLSLIVSTKYVSPVTDLQWLPLKKGCFSSHENGEINFWTYPLLSNTKRFEGHRPYAVLHISMSPNNKQLMSLGMDETVKIWNTFPPEEKRKECSSPSLLSGLHVR